MGGGCQQWWPLMAGNKMGVAPTHASYLSKRKIFAISWPFFSGKNGFRQKTPLKGAITGLDIYPDFRRSWTPDFNHKSAPLGYNTSNELCFSFSIFHFEGLLPLIVVNHKGVGPGICFITNFLWYFFNQPLSRVWPPWGRACLIASLTILMIIAWTTFKLGVPPYYAGGCGSLWAHLPANGSFSPAPSNWAANSICLGFSARNRRTSMARRRPGRVEEAGGKKLRWWQN